MGEYVPGRANTPAPVSVPNSVAPAAARREAASTQARVSTVGASSQQVAPRSAASTSEVSPTTWQIWVIALLPLVPYVSGAFLDTMSLLFNSSTTSPDAQLQTVTHPAFVTFFVSAWVMFIANFFLAYSDGKKLERRGVPYPLPFGLIYFGSLVYVIGRSSNVKRYLGTGLAPLWASLAVLVVGVAVYVFVVAQLIQQFPAAIAKLQGF